MYLNRKKNIVWDCMTSFVAIQYYIVPSITFLCRVSKKKIIYLLHAEEIQWEDKLNTKPMVSGLKYFYY